MPLPPHRESDLTRAERSEVNLAAFARLVGQPFVRDAAHDVWIFGESATARHEALSTLKAPDFTLPDIEGRSRSLFEYRGRKVFLVSWASW